MFQISGPTYRIDNRLLEKVAKAAFSCLEREFEVNLGFVSGEKIKELNRIYRGNDKVTDVLSFKLEEDSEGGDIIICLSVAKKQAQKAEMSVDEEVAFLLTHGILHLAGYNHYREGERRVMETLENDILKTVKIEVKR